MINIKYSEILKENTKLGQSLTGEYFNILILSNIITTQFNEILEYTLRIEKIPARVHSGDYDNIVQDSRKYGDSSLVIVFWELCNLIDGLQHKIELFDDNQYKNILEKSKSEIALVLKNLKDCPLVLFNEFSSVLWTGASVRNTAFDRLAAELNSYLKANLKPNLKLVNLGKIIAKVGIARSADLRYYYSSKALYTVEFYKAYAVYVRPFVLAGQGRAKKALIFDCDNTLWKGILGEDGFDNIEMSPATRDGAVFSEVQNIALHLSRQGILIGLCSKNNPDDVQAVIESHPDMRLRSDNITINKSNWLDKVSNLKNIANELNIGLDSLVFVDDSPFEVNLVKENLPEVTVMQVPENLYEYPLLLRDNTGLFYNLSYTEEDRKKIEMYRQQVNRETDKNEFKSIDDYLSSLKLEVVVHEDDRSIIPRMSQMSQKTNQFNLTTKRYTEGDIERFIAARDYMVLAFSVSDRYGDSGVTGLLIARISSDASTADIDTFLMSCRIIGRNIEFAFLDYFIRLVKSQGIGYVTAKFIKTPKNEQVLEFYDKLGFRLVHFSEIERIYNLGVNHYSPRNIDYIRIQDGRQN